MNPYNDDPGNRPFHGQDPYQNDPYQRNPYQQPRQYREPGSSGMAAASVVLGVCSFVLMLSGLSPLLGGLGILLALLSRGSGTLSGTGKAGLIASAAGLVIGTGVMVFVIITALNSSVIQQYNELFQEYYEDDYGDYEDPGDSDFYDYYDDFLDEYGFDQGDDYKDYFIPDDGWYETVPGTPDSKDIL